MSKIALVTGASRGIGRAIAILLAKNGYRVCVNFNKNEGEARSVVKQILDFGGHAIPIRANIADEKQVIKMFEFIDHDFGRLDVLVNNAGILFTQCSIAELDSERINKIFTVNVTGTMICSREAVKRMSTMAGGSGGVIVNLSSRAAIWGSPNEYLDYAASKGAIDTFTTGLAKEVADKGIRVNAVRPGLIYTDMHADGGEKGRVERLSSSVPLKRGGYPEEVAEAVYWLISDKSAFTTGTFIDVSGGR